MTRDELSATIGDVLKDWWFQDASMGATQERLTARLEPFMSPGVSPALGPILAALGWSGGTVEQVVAEVGRLRMAEETSYRLGEIVQIKLNEHAWIDGGIVGYANGIIGRFPVEVRKKLDQGVAALLPEHGEAGHGRG